MTLINTVQTDLWARQQLREDPRGWSTSSLHAGFTLGKHVSCKQDALHASLVWTRHNTALHSCSGIVLLCFKCSPASHDVMKIASESKNPPLRFSDIFSQTDGNF